MLMHITPPPHQEGGQILIKSAGKKMKNWEIKMQFFHSFWYFSQIFFKFSLKSHLFSQFRKKKLFKKKFSKRLFSKRENDFSRKYTNLH